MPDNTENQKSSLFDAFKKIASDVAKAAGDIGSSVASTATDAASTIGSTLSDSVGKYGSAAVTEVAKAASTVGKGVASAADGIGKQTVKLVDRNGDGKLDEEDILAVLGSVYESTVNGIPKVSKPIDVLAEEYLQKYRDPATAAKKLIENSLIKCTTSGFLTGFGGFIVLPVTLPANVTSVIFVQMRMIAALAYMAGLDVKSDATQTLVYACLAGVSVAEVVKKVGIQIGQKMTTAMVKKIPGKVLTKINQRVGFRLLTKFGEKGVINIGKMIPVVGAVISGGFDLAETKVIADRAYKEFIEGDFAISGKDDEPDEFIEAEMIPDDEQYNNDAASDMR